MKKLFVGIGAAIERDGKFLILKRSENKNFAPDAWEIVTGRIEEEESPETGVLREVFEETGTDVEIVMPVQSGFFYRGAKEFPMVFITYWCRHISGEVKLSWEHSAFRWVGIDDILKEQTMEHFFHTFERIRILRNHLPDDFKLNG
ncbi:MAG: NUDIX domain-containing protein [Candidatus Thorarchaeota archaeon]|jgi:8-oxo-dGTP pyrophosphatase MutT (NUDIX family)